jgi:hypothetical protein
MHLLKATLILTTPSWSGVNGTHDSYVLSDEWRGMLSVQFIAIQLSYRLLYIWHE